MGFQCISYLDGRPYARAFLVPTETTTTILRMCMIGEEDLRVGVSRLCELVRKAVESQVHISEQPEKVTSARPPTEAPRKTHANPALALVEEPKYLEPKKEKNLSAGKLDTVLSNDMERCSARPTLLHSKQFPRGAA